MVIWIFLVFISLFSALIENDLNLLKNKDTAQNPDAVGSFYAKTQTPDTETCVSVELYLFLEGSYLSGQNLMHTELNTLRGLLPGQIPANQLISPTPPGNPYRDPPWVYFGTQDEETYSGPYVDSSGLAVVDWILISFRSSPSNLSEFREVNGLLFEDGHIEFLQPCVLLDSDPNPVWIVIEHRNHMGVMTDTAVTVNDGTLVYDFRQTDSYHSSNSFGQKQIEPGVYVMFVGDTNQAEIPSYDINGIDNVFWSQNNGTFDSYSSDDFNMNGDVNGFDLILWAENFGISSAVLKD